MNDDLLVTNPKVMAENLKKKIMIHAEFSSLQCTIPTDDCSVANGLGTSVTEEEQYFKDTLAAYRRATDVVARIQAAFREQSFKMKAKAVEFANEEDEARCIIAALKIHHAYQI
ncbi:calmodulin-binding transcription activator 5-like [Rutidosis leptorrhynchoides]|uniref:calmodulin-binding transcription activator 5-like n=1 Tax=Rutidosis leptorrhynchoides TaxID=125765 RepID=UPI003A99DA2A